MVTFNLIEGDDILDRIGDDFVRMYDDGESIVKICETLDITRAQFQNLKQRLVRRGLIKNVRNRGAGRKKTILKGTKSNPKNYFYSRQYKGFFVRKKARYYTCFKKEEDAKRYVELMRECDWDFNRRYELKEKVLNGI